MYKIFSFLFLGIITLFFLPSFAIGTTTQKIHHFTIIAPPTAKVGEALDVTVEAKDKDDKLISDYRGSIYFQSDTDFGATIPAQWRSVQFKESDNGSLKLSKWVTFKRVGDQVLTVTDAVEDAGWSITIKIEEGTLVISTGATESITITTPEKWSSITSDNVDVSGNTKKNSKVILKLNGTEVATLVSNDVGIFTKNLPNITQTTNILSASVLDGNNTVIGTTETSFGMMSWQPKFYNISVLPSLDVETGTGIVFTIDAEPGLTEVSIGIDWSILIAREESPGKYISSTTSPAKPGTYPIQVNLKNVLAQTFSKSSASILNVVEKATPIIPVITAKFKNVQAVTEGSKIIFTFGVENIPSGVEKFKIAYGESADSLTSESITFVKEKIVQPDGSYKWYIANLPVKAYTFKIFAVKNDGSLVPDLSSETLSATIWKWSCSIGNVGTISVATSSDKSILSWDSLSGAISYNIYRVTAAKDYELIQNTKESTYTLYLSSGAIVHEDFAVKALCDDKTESSTPSIASKVQTWPGALAILVIISALLSIFFIRRKVY